MAPADNDSGPPPSYEVLLPVHILYLPNHDSPATLKWDRGGWDGGGEGAGVKGGDGYHGDIAAQVYTRELNGDGWEGWVRTQERR